MLKEENTSGNHRCLKLRAIIRAETVYERIACIALVHRRCLVVVPRRLWRHETTLERNKKVKQRRLREGMVICTARAACLLWLDKRKISQLIMAGPIPSVDNCADQRLPAFRQALTHTHTHRVAPATGQGHQAGHERRHCMPAESSRRLGWKVGSLPLLSFCSFFPLYRPAFSFFFLPNPGAFSSLDDYCLNGRQAQTALVTRSSAAADGAITAACYFDPNMHKMFRERLRASCCPRVLAAQKKRRYFIRNLAALGPTKMVDSGLEMVVLCEIQAAWKHMSFGMSRWLPALL